MNNPFVYGEVVPVTSFVDRVDELDRLVRDLDAGQKVFLISPRRYGKSSLIRQALRAAARRGALTAEITVSSYSSYLAFLEGYAQALLAMQTGWEKARAWLREAIGVARPEIRFDADSTGSVGIAVSFPSVRTEREVSRLAAEVFELPRRLAELRRRTLVIALDEFQAIRGFDGGSVEHALRAAVQRQRDVAYVFAGSEPSLMERMLGPKRPFYKAGPVMRLEKIPPDVFATFIESRFARNGFRPEPEIGRALPPSRRDRSHSSSAWMCQQTRCANSSRSQSNAPVPSIMVPQDPEASIISRWNSLISAPVSTSCTCPIVASPTRRRICSAERSRR